MVLERTAAYVLAVMCVFQTLLPSGAIKTHRWRSINVQAGRLRIQASNEADSARWMLLLESWHKEPKRLEICIDDSGCMMAWLDGASHTWMISRDEGELPLCGD